MFIALPARINFPGESLESITINNEPPEEEGYFKLGYIDRHAIVENEFYRKVVREVSLKGGKCSFDDLGTAINIDADIVSVMKRLSAKILDSCEQICQLYSLAALLLYADEGAMAPSIHFQLDLPRCGPTFATFNDFLFFKRIKEGPGYHMRSFVFAKRRGGEGKGSPEDEPESYLRIEPPQPPNTSRMKNLILRPGSN